MSKKRLFESAELEGEAKNMRLSAKRLDKLDKREREEQKTPPVGFKFPDDVLVDAEPSVVTERIQNEKT
jgi:hypothetical protein